MFDSIDDTGRLLATRGYFADPSLSTSLFLALRMQKALFLEGEPGVGKTDLARVVSDLLEAPLIRLQCYEGLDLAQAVYEWDYSRQLLEIQMQAAGTAGVGDEEGAEGSEGGQATDIFSEDFLLRRPLLRAIDRSHDRSPVLLIDELDRADEEFESFLLELLDDFQITVPELGTFQAENRPVTVVTSNRTREIHDALKRRCIYHWIEYPTFEREVEILERKVPEAGSELTRQVVAFIQRVRTLELYKRPGVSETLDWARALTHLGAERLDPGIVDHTLGLLVKYQDDVETLRGDATEALLEEVDEVVGA